MGRCRANPRIAVDARRGGARGAYEVGALSVLLPELERRGERPSIFVGTSVGAINAAGLAATSHLSAEESIARELARWREVEPAAVIKPVIWRLPLTAMRFAGGLLGLPGVRLESLLDPTPLERNLRTWIEWPQLHRHVAQGPVGSLAVVATAARSGRSVAFVEGRLPPGARRSRVIDYVAAELDQAHVRASAAIPILFPPVRITQPPAAAGWYVDGGTRLNTPIKPAIDLGAERVVVVGTGPVAPVARHTGRHDAPAPDFGVSALHLLEGALVDPLVEDLRKLGDINSFYANGSRLEGPPSPRARAPAVPPDSVHLHRAAPPGRDRGARYELVSLPLRRPEGGALARSGRAQPAARHRQPHPRRAAQLPVLRPRVHRRADRDGPQRRACVARGTAGARAAVAARRFQPAFRARWAERGQWAIVACSRRCGSAGWRRAARPSPGGR
jgi:predicted acylesterase/phospholipase RssA